MFFESGDKFNAVDSENTLIGFDYGSNCCESFGWFVANDVVVGSIPDEKEQDRPAELDGFCFNREFFASDKDSECYDSGGAAVFQLEAVDGRKKYLHLYNAHNGYYSHGFTVKHGGVVVREDSL